MINGAEEMGVHVKERETGVSEIHIVCCECVQYSNLYLATSYIHVRI